MADLEISNLDPIVNPDSSVDLFAVVSDGVTKKSTIDNFITDYLVGAANIGGDSDWLGPGQTVNTSYITHLGNVNIGVANIPLSINSFSVIFIPTGPTQPISRIFDSPSGRM